MELIYEKSQPGRRAGRVPSYDLPVPKIPAELLREAPPRLPEVPENEIVRHFTALADRPFHRLSDMLRVLPAMMRLESWRSVHGMVAKHIRDPRLRQAFTFEPLLEQSLLEAVRNGDAGSWLAVDPMRMEALIEGIGVAVNAAENAGHRAAVVCAAQLRPSVRRLLAAARPDLKVLSYSELSRSVNIEPVGVIRLAERALV